MTISLKVEATGVQDALARSPLVLRYVDQALGTGAALIQREAVRAAPKADGTLARNIQSGRLQVLLHQINSRAAHGAYVERGTGLYGPERRAPGKGGLGTNGLANIAAWIRRRGITPRNGVTPQQLPFLIARKIARDGTRAQPYLEPANNRQNAGRIADLVQAAARRGLTEAGLIR